MSERYVPDQNREAGHSKKFHDFFNLSPAEEEGLKQRLMGSDGVARLIVHPFYRDPTDPKERGISSRWRRVGDTLKRWVEQNTQNAPPLFVMQEAEAGAKTQWAAEFSNTEVVNPPYVVSTEIGQPHPVVRGDQEAKQRLKLSFKARDERRDSAGIPNAPRVKNMQLEKQRAESWEIFIHKLKTYGVRKLILGGNLLAVKPEDYNNLNFYSAKPDKAELVHCVGESYGRLAKDFDVDLSFYSSPHNLLEVKKVIAIMEEMNKLRQAAADGQIDSGEARQKFKMLKDAMMRVLEEGRKK